MECPVKAAFRRCHQSGSQRLNVLKLFIMATFDNAHVRMYLFNVMIIELFKENQVCVLLMF